MDREETRKNKLIKRESAVSMGTATEQNSVDWRGRPCKPNKHGGMTAAIFVLCTSLFSFSLQIHIHPRFEFEWPIVIILLPKTSLKIESRFS